MLKTIGKKLKLFFKKFWYVFLIPTFVFLWKHFSKRTQTEIDADIKKKKEEIEKEKEELKKSVEGVEKKEKKVQDQNENVKKVYDKNIENKEDRDEQAKQFFPDL